VQTGDLHIIIKLSIDKFQGFHSGDNLVDWKLYLKQNFNELGERGPKAEVVLRVPVLTQVHIRDSFNQVLHFLDAEDHLSLELGVLEVDCVEFDNFLELALYLLTHRVVASSYSQGFVLHVTVLVYD